MLAQIHWVENIVDYKETIRDGSKIQAITLNGHLLFLSIDQGVPIYIFRNQMQLLEELNYTCSRDITPVHDEKILMSSTQHHYLKEIDKCLKGGAVRLECEARRE